MNEYDDMKKDKQLLMVLMALIFVSMYITSSRNINWGSTDQNQKMINLNQPMINLHINGEGSMGISTNTPKKRLDTNDPGLFISTTNNVSLSTFNPTNRIIITDDPDLFTNKIVFKYDSQSIITNREIPTLGMVAMTNCIENYSNSFISRIPLKNPIQLINPTNYNFLTNYHFLVCNDSDTNIVLRITGMTNYSRPVSQTSVIVRLWTKDGTEWKAKWEKE